MDRALKSQVHGMDHSGFLTMALGFREKGWWGWEWKLNTWLPFPVLARPPCLRPLTAQSPYCLTLGCSPASTKLLAVLREERPCDLQARGGHLDKATCARWVYFWKQGGRETPVQ